VLPPELTRARKREGKLTLSALSSAERARACELSTALIASSRTLVGSDREQVEAAWASLPTSPKERKLLLGLTHLVEQHAEFAAPESVDPESVRRAVFGRAVERRSALADGEHLDRDAVLAEVGAEMGLAPATLEAALYADLRSAQRLQACSLPTPEALVAEYELLQVQSVLLRSVRIEAEVRAARPDAYRELFRKLKFRQLLHRIQTLSPTGYKVTIDGPMSLFGATTKYGLELSLSLPALLACGQLKLKAELRWGKRREKLDFELVNAGVADPSGSSGVRTEVVELLQALHAAKSPWQARLSDELIDLTEEGGAVLVPDIELRSIPMTQPAKPNERPEPAEGSVLIELLGYWSRDAVFRRIEAAEKGLKRKVLFVVSSRLRVSEELLDGVEAAGLYVYKGKINVHALLRKVEGLVSHGHTRHAPAGRAVRLQPGDPERR